MRSAAVSFTRTRFVVPHSLRRRLIVRVAQGVLYSSVSFFAMSSLVKPSWNQVAFCSSYTNSRSRLSANVMLYAFWYSILRDLLVTREHCHSLYFLTATSSCPGISRGLEGLD